MQFKVYVLSAQRDCNAEHTHFSAVQHYILKEAGSLSKMTLMGICVRLFVVPEITRAGSDMNININVTRAIEEHQYLFCRHNIVAEVIVDAALIVC